MISIEKWKILTTLQKLPKNVGNLAKLIVATSSEKLPKVQLIAQSGHTGHSYLMKISHSKAWSSLVEGGEGSYLPKW